MTLEQLRLAVIAYLASQPERFPALPTSLDDDVIAITDNEATRCLLALVPEWAEPAIFEIANYVYERYWSSDDKVVYVTGRIPPRAPEELQPEIMAAHDNPDRCVVWVVNDDGSVQEFEN